MTRATDPPSRVLLLTDSDAFAGTERHMLSLAVGLKRVGVDVRVGVPDGVPLATRAAGEGVAVETVPRAGRPATRALRRLLRQPEPWLVHAHNGRSAALAAAAMTYARRGTLVTSQHFLTPTRATRRGWRRWVSDLLHGLVSRRIAATICVSEAAFRAAVRRGEDPSRLHVIPNGIDPPRPATPAAEVRRALGMHDDQRLVLTVARFVPEKGLDVLVHAAWSVTRLRSDVVFVVAGDGPLADRLRQSAGDSVRFTGFRDDVADLVDACDAFVLPAPAEPFGLVLLEAMALGKPVVACAAGGPLEIVVPGETGLLVQPDSHEELADAVLRLVDQAGAAAVMGEAGRRRFLSHFTAGQMTLRTLDVYRKIGLIHPQRVAATVTPAGAGGA